MSTSDPLDGKIREALADVISRAPLAPQFENLTPHPGRGHRTGRLLAAAAVVVAVGVAGVALAERGDVKVSSRPAGRSPDNAGAQESSCVRQLAKLISSGTDVIVYLDPTITPDQLQSVQAALLTEPAIAALTYLDREQAHAEFRELFAESPEFIDNVEPEDLSSRFDVQVATGPPVDVVTAVVDEMPGVAAVIGTDEAVASLERSCDESADERPGPSTTVSPPATERSGNPPTSTGEEAGSGADAEVAVWAIDVASPPTSTSTSFTAMVTRLSCNGGETGDVADVLVAEEDDRIVVSVTVEPLPPAVSTCQGNLPVPVQVQLATPIGGRELVDGTCLSGEATATSFCTEGPVRWAP